MLKNKRDELELDIAASLTDADLMDFYQAIVKEMRRRVEMLQTKRDCMQIVKSHEIVKRAIKVATSGQFSLALIGPQGSGKTLLRKVALQMGCVKTYEMWPCPCGNRNSVSRVCFCETDELKAYFRLRPQADMWIEVPDVPAREFEHNLVGIAIADEIKQIEEAEQRPMPTAYAEGTEWFIRTAVSEKGMTAAEVATVRLVAATIARLDDSKVIQLHHLTEAINYRPLGWFPNECSPVKTKMRLKRRSAKK